ncbi:MAG: ASKHA domain-containing protein, partial [Methanoregulaceae archaeon]|nr:ASKHA domain-containing protein [Methanoregulaceae archaeon]
MPTVTFLPSYRKVQADAGCTLLDAAQRAGLQMNVVCGGQGKCGKCIVYIKSGRSSFDHEKFGKFFTPDELAEGACLACQTIVEDDIQVFIPENSLVQEQKILMEGLGLETEFHPAVWKYSLILSPPTLEDPSPDLTRLLWSVQKHGGPLADKIYAPLEVLRRTPRVLRDSGWQVTATVELVPGGYRLIDLEKGDTARNLYGAAVDLGTTTIVVYIRSLVDGHVVGVASNYNRQISCGEDILSRVNFARKGGLDRLSALSAESINAAITTAANAAGVDREDIYEVVVAGNTIMTHILMGIDPAYMIEEPYVPVVRRYLTTAAQRVGIDVAEDAGAFIFPAVSDFIGGDIVADILASGMAEQEDISLLIDIGTNFEVVLGNREWMFSCAGAAGPALEGGEVLFGMRANPGAIERISIDPGSLEPKFETINGTRPKGVCGSGLIDLLAELLRACVIDRTGRINMERSNPRIRQGAYFPEYVIAWKAETAVG